MEIEKKYLIKKMPDITDVKRAEIEQAYISRKPVLRIRKKDDKYIFTFKSGIKGPDDVQVSRETEEYITKEEYDSLMKKSEGFRISKTRYIIPLENGLIGELDVFHGRLEGLVFIEVEFPDMETAERFKPPVWFGEDVTQDKRYRNGYLSTLEKYTGFE
jgi:CYTH domain-containing protein